MRSSEQDRRLVVLQSFPRPRPTTNPYLVMLADSLRAVDGVEVWNFSWSRALRGGYDVFHVHWPEILVSGQSPAKKAVRQVLFVLFLLRLRVTRTPLVRTAHNLELPSGISRREVLLLTWADRWTTLRIRVNDSTELPGDVPVETVVHGHYRDWYAPHRRSEPVPGRLTFFGLVRRYKGVDRLLTAFGDTAGSADALQLRIAGRPSSTDLAGELTRLAADDDRVSLSLSFLDDAELVREVTAAELVVLPYREMHNSGGALTALSLGRPVLVPDNVVNRRLSEEAGPGWVHRYRGDLDAADLLGALAALRSAPPHGAPDLGRRDWDRAGPAHRDAYRRAIALAHGAARPA
jgi:beta-1,4-mannosyltransferase